MDLVFLKVTLEVFHFIWKPLPDPDLDYFFLDFKCVPGGFKILN